MYYSCQKGILDINIYWSLKSSYMKQKTIFISNKIIFLLWFVYILLFLGQYSACNLDCICKKWSYVCLRHKKIKLGISWFCLYYLNSSNKALLLRTTFEYVSMEYYVMNFLVETPVKTILFSITFQTIC